MAEALEDRRLLTTWTTPFDGQSDGREAWGGHHYYNDVYDGDGFPIDHSQDPPGIRITYSTVTAGNGIQTDLPGPDMWCDEGQAVVANLPTGHTMARIVIDAVPVGTIQGAPLSVQVSSGGASATWTSDYITNSGTETTPWFAHTGGTVTVRLKDATAAGPTGWWYVRDWGIQLYNPTVSIAASDGAIGEATAAPMTNAVVATRDLPTGYVGTSAGDAAVPDVDVALTLGGTAMRNDDHVLAANNETLTTAAFKIKGSQSSASLTITPRKDNLVEGLETITLAASGGGATSGSAKTVNIADDPPRVRVATLQDGSEDSDAAGTVTTPKPVQFELTRTGGDLTQAIDVNFAIAGTGAHPTEAADFVGTLPTHKEVNGETTVTLPVADDTGSTAVEFRETVSFALAAGDHNLIDIDFPAEVTAEVRDNDYALKEFEVSLIAKESPKILAESIVARNGGI